MVKMTSEIVKATRLPVTVKTRLGWDDKTKNVVDAAERLQDIGIEALTIHGRTRVQMYKGEADWTLIGEIKNNPRITIPVFGNGDVDTPEKALSNRQQYGVDGIMIGRASIGYPWIFREIKHFLATGELLEGPTLQERVDTCRAHFSESLKWKGDVLGVLEMRRHYHSYFKGFHDFKPYREKLVYTMNPQDIFDLLDEILYVYSQPVIEEVLG
jgi:nifR3 family TIM-barrel protein